MKKLIIILIGFLFVINGLYAQSGDLNYQNGVWRNGYKLLPADVKTLMAGEPQCLSLYNSGRTSFILGQVIGCPSAFLFGYDIGGRLAGGEGNNTLLAVGGLGFGAGLLLTLLGEKKIKTSVELFNNSRQADKLSLQMDFGLTDDGNVGFVFRF